VTLDGQTAPGDGSGAAVERRRARVDRSGRAVDRAVRHTVHRTASTVAEDIVNEVMRAVGRQLLMADDDVLRQSADTQQATYDTCSLHYLTCLTHTHAHAHTHTHL